MLRALFEALESSLGPQVDGPGRWLWLLGVASVALVVLAPLARAALDGRLTHAGLTLGWTKHCARCGARTLLTAKGCEKCGAGLPLPLGVKLQARLSAPGTPSKHAAVRWGPALVGAGVFAVATFILASSSDLPSPTGKLERALAGGALLTWAGVGMLLGRALSLKGLRLLDRVRALLFAGAAAVVLVAAVSLAQAARPAKTTPVVKVEAQDGAVLVNGQRLATENDEVSVEYQLLEVPSAGVANLTPLAVTAKGGRVKLPHGRAEDWLLERIWARAPGLQSHGVTVKRRTEQFRVAPGMKYQVRAAAKEVLLVPTSAPPEE